MHNLSLLTDLYQLTMINGFLKSKTAHKRAVFDVFFRQNGQFNYAVMAGLESVCTFIESLSFGKEEIDYLKSLNRFSDELFDYLKNFKFSGDIMSALEGTVIFPNEPILTVYAPIAECLLLETAILNFINHQTLIATKASKICLAAGDSPVIEFGARRAYGADAAVYGARAAVIGGCAGTSNVLAGQKFGLKVYGTQGHSWIMSFPDELEAFREFAALYPENCLLLVDTIDTLASGVKNAITVFNELKERGIEPLGVRLDSGDLAYLSKKARQMFDLSGLTNVKIMASNDIDENLIMNLKAQGARIDMYGVGTKLITSDGISSLGGVFKMSAMEGEGGELIPKIKISNTLEKTTTPMFKEVYRICDNESGKAIADLICIKGEKLADPLVLTHPLERWKSITIQNYKAESLLKNIFVNGKRVYSLPSIESVATYAFNQKELFWDEYKRLINPHIYKVDLSDKLYELKQSLLKKH